MENKGICPYSYFAFRRRSRYVSYNACYPPQNKTSEIYAGHSFDYSVADSLAYSGDIIWKINLLLPFPTIVTE